MPETSCYNTPTEEVMNRDPPLVERSTPIEEVARIVSKETHAWVVEGKDSKKLVGAITETDLLDIVSPLPSKSYAIGVISPRSLRHTEFEKAEDIMAKPVIKCNPKATIEEALSLMTSHRVRRLAVAENDEILGELSLNIVINTCFSI